MRTAFCQTHVDDLCRASTAATKCQTQLQSVTERDTEGLKNRIATAESAVQEAEQSAAEAVRLQNEIVQAASMAEGHCDVAKSQSNVAERVCCTITALHALCSHRMFHLAVDMHVE